jgi:hypothetical protein
MPRPVAGHPSTRDSGVAAIANTQDRIRNRTQHPGTARAEDALNAAIPAIACSQRAVNARIRKKRTFARVAVNARIRKSAPSRVAVNARFKKSAPLRVAVNACLIESRVTQ